MEDLWPIIASVLGVALVMVAGALCRKLHWLTAQADRSLASLTANVLLPALFFDRVLTSPRLDSLADSWLPPLIGFLVTAIGFAVAALVVSLVGPAIGLETPEQRRPFVLCVGICNYGYVPLPLAMQFFPEAEVTLIIHNVGVDLALWSLGVMIISGRMRGQWRRALLSPPLIAVVLALGLKQLGASEWFPTPLAHAAESLGRCSIPMGLLLSGAIIVDFLKQIKWHEGKRVVGLAIALRLLLLPLGMLAFAGYAGLATDMQQVLLLQAAMPAATFPIVLVRLYDQDINTALKVVLGTSLVSLLTIPLWLWAGGAWLGV